MLHVSCGGSGGDGGGGTCDMLLNPLGGCDVHALRTRQWQASSGVTLTATPPPPPQGAASRSTVVSPTGSATTLADSAGHLSCAPPSTGDVNLAPTAHAAPRL
jgi:hypothetical protein